NIRFTLTYFILMQLDLLLNENIHLVSKTSKAYNALLSSEARNTNASALLRKHKSHCKPKLPRVPNLLEQFVIQNFARLTLNLDA
ncbi:hypothetical protein WOB62_24035, partial [Vibrio parahaemolyticus]